MQDVSKINPSLNKHLNCFNIKPENLACVASTDSQKEVKKGEEGIQA